MAISFSGINIYAKDPIKAYEFYKGIGFTVKEVDDIPTDGEPIGEYWGAVFENHALISIWNDTNRDESRKNSRNELVINCGGIDNMNVLYEDLKTKGYDINKPEQQFYGGWEMHLTDLDGNKILFLD